MRFIPAKRKKYDELEFWNDPRPESRRYAQYRRLQLNNTNKSKRTLKKYNGNVKVKKRAQNESKQGGSQHDIARKVKNASISQKGVFRADSKWKTMNVSWPNAVPNLRAKRFLTRFTKMMLQEAPEVSTQHIPSNEDEEAKYFSPYNIKRQFSSISSKFPNTNITVEVIGRTAEYNDIVMMRISEMTDTQRHFRTEDKYADEPPQKKIVFIVHGLSVMGMTSLTYLSVDTEFTKLLSYYLRHLDHFDIFVIPMANPDGITMLQTKIIWNKNASPQNACPGVNVDRNFDVAWNSSSVVSSCSQHYPGPEAFSEAESRAIRDVFHKYSHKIIAYMHVHAGTYNDMNFKGEAVLYPKGYSDTQSDDDKYIDLKGDIDEVMRNASFRTVTVKVDTLHNWYGKISGSSVDYAATVYGIPYSLELVMQLYQPGKGDTEESAETSAFVEIWSRVIDVIFKRLWKHMHQSDS